MTGRVFISLVIVIVELVGCTAVEPTREGRQQPQEVLGTVVIGFAPTAFASLPDPPVDLMLHIRPSAGRRDVIYKIADGTAVWEVATPTLLERKVGRVGASYQNFRLKLSPGEYLVTGFDVRAKSLSATPVFLPTGGLSFSVPDGNCVYIGRVGGVYSRLEPGSFDQAKTQVGSMSAELGKPVFMIYLTTGALVPVSGVSDQPKDDEQTSAGLYARQLLAYAHERGCAVQLAR